MTIRDFIRGELVDIIEWLEDSTDTMVWRFARPDNEIKNGAQLIVRPGQVAVLVDQGTVADVFYPGIHQLQTSNLPVLSRLRGWKYGFESPFKAEVVFVSSRQFPNRKWGTKSPVITRDPEFGPVRLRAFGTYAVRVWDAPLFVRELVGANAAFAIDQIADQLRNLVVARFSDVLAEQAIPLMQLASNYAELGDRVTERLRAEFRQFGLEVLKVVLENVSVPAEVEGALDQRTRMGIIGDPAAYARFQAADALRDAARNPNGAAASGAGVGIGFAVAQPAQQLAVQPTGPAPRPTPRSAAVHEPPPLPHADWFHVVVGGERRGPLDPAALRQLAREGALTGDTLVWRPGMAAWTPAAGVREVAELLAM